MNIENEKVVIIHYTLKNEAGNVLDTSEGQDPLGYLHGKKNIIPGLEKALDGKSQGEKINVTIDPAEAYGPHDEQLIRDVPAEQFQNPGELTPGTNLQVQNEHGSQIVTVVEVSEASIKVDFNHPLAGQTLFFDVEIVDVRDATPDELEHGHIHGPGCNH